MGFASMRCSRCAQLFPSTAVTGDAGNDLQLCEPCRGAVFAAEHDDECLEASVDGS